LVLCEGQQTNFFLKIFTFFAVLRTFSRTMVQTKATTSDP